jgi:hypothetical protein
MIHRHKQFAVIYTILLALCCVVSLGLSPQAVRANSEKASDQSVLADSGNSTKQYVPAEAGNPAKQNVPTGSSDANTQSGPVDSADTNKPAGYFGGRSVAPLRLLMPEGMQYEDVVQRPFLYWRLWINQCLPFRRLVVFFLFVSTALQMLCGPTLIRAKEHYEKKWLRSLGVGILSSVFGVTAVVGMARMGLFVPLATVLLAIVQLSGLLGLSIASMSIGESVLRLTRLEKVLPKPWLKTFAALWTGTILLSLLMLIPGAGPLPRLGNRILAFIAVTGAGALLTFLRSRQEGDN